MNIFDFPTTQMTPLIGKREAVASEIFALEAALHRLSISATLFLVSCLEYFYLFK